MVSLMCLPWHPTVACKLSLFPAPAMPLVDIAEAAVWANRTGSPLEELEDEEWEEPLEVEAGVPLLPWNILVTWPSGR